MYHSSLGLRVIKKKNLCDGGVRAHAREDAAREGGLYYTNALISLVKRICVVIFVTRKIKVFPRMNQCDSGVPAHAREEAAREGGFYYTNTLISLIKRICEVKFVTRKSEENFFPPD